MRRNAAGLALFLSWPGIVFGQQTRVVQPNPQDSLAGSYRIYEPAGLSSRVNLDRTEGPRGGDRAVILMGEPCQPFGVATSLICE